MVDATLVTVHGFWSSPATWDRLRAVWQADDALDGLDVYGFGYPSPKKPRLPLSWTRIPDLDDIAQMLAAEYTTVLGKAASVAFVTHSQGGLVLQRFLAWMISEGRARETRPDPDDRHARLPERRLSVPCIDSPCPRLRSPSAGRRPESP